MLLEIFRIFLGGLEMRLVGFERFLEVYMCKSDLQCNKKNLERK